MVCKVSGLIHRFLKMIKPHIYKNNGDWYCVGLGVISWSDAPCESYDKWLLCTGGKN